MKSLRSAWLLAMAISLVGFATYSAQAARPALTASRYRARANAICAAGDRLPAPTGSGISIVTVAFQRLDTAWAMIGSLRPPSSLEPLHEKVTAVGRMEVQWLSTELAKLREKQVTLPQLARSMSAQSFGTQEDKLWKRLGVKVCAEPS